MRRHRTQKIKYVIISLLLAFSSSCSYKNSIIPTLSEEKIEMLEICFRNPDVIDSVVAYNNFNARKALTYKSEAINSREKQLFEYFVKNIILGDYDIEVNETTFIPFIFLNGAAYQALSFECNVLVVTDHDSIKFNFLRYSDEWILDNITDLKEESKNKGKQRCEDIEPR